ncbi:hypothetical protein CHS0354_016826 [Potamilus streckersoni]|uniref:C-type lectin domain-containing protein n=1 Tax=Potamilus streckersoni TaxID=2493646 RepID=A0AAE0SVJ4_9BIVA|nr:hypothetical protein CHS0354_016826 [Potamilus streckersoni]
MRVFKMRFCGLYKVILQKQTSRFCGLYKVILQKQISRFCGYIRLSFTNKHRDSVDVLAHLVKTYIMKLLQVGFLCMTLSALVGRIFSKQYGFPGGFGEFSGIYGLLILLVFIAAISRRPLTECPTNYISISPGSSTCIRFFTDGKSFADAKTACQSDGGVLLGLDLATFDMVRALADENKGIVSCDFWVGATEAASGVWSGSNGKSISTLGGLFFETAGDFDDNAANECGILDNTRSFFLYGSTCTNLKCYICQRNKIN